jgi:hypothetical protein
MARNGKGLMFKLKNLGTEEFFTLEELQEKTFDQLAIELWERLRRKPASGLKPRLNDFAPEVRQPIKFSWQKPNGEWQFITGASNVLAFWAQTGAREIVYYTDTIGG